MTRYNDPYYYLDVIEQLEQYAEKYNAHLPTQLFNGPRMSLGGGYVGGLVREIHHIITKLEDATEQMYPSIGSLQALCYMPCDPELIPEVLDTILLEIDEGAALGDGSGCCGGNQVEYWFKNDEGELTMEYRNPHDVPNLDSLELNYDSDAIIDSLIVDVIDYMDGDEE